jgi:hypothetical protein
MERRFWLPSGRAVVPQGRNQIFSSGNLMYADNLNLKQESGGLQKRQAAQGLDR